MKLALQTLIVAARDTLADPHAAARRVMALNLSETEGLMALALCAALATLLTASLRAIMGPLVDPAMEDILGRPFVLALSQFALMVVGAALMWRVGKIFGGTGTFAQALSLVAWLEVVLILLQVAETVALMIFPIVAAIVGLASLFAFFYLLTQFTAALNGFTSLAKTFFGILATAITLLLLTSVLLVLFLPVPNV